MCVSNKQKKSLKWFKEHIFAVVSTAITIILTVLGALLEVNHQNAISERDKEIDDLFHNISELENQRKLDAQKIDDLTKALEIARLSNSNLKRQITMEQYKHEKIEHALANIEINLNEVVRNLFGTDILATEQEKKFRWHAEKLLSKKESLSKLLEACEALTENFSLFSPDTTLTAKLMLRKREDENNEIFDILEQMLTELDSLHHPLQYLDNARIVESKPDDLIRINNNLDDISKLVKHIKTIVMQSRIASKSIPDNKQIGSQIKVFWDQSRVAQITELDSILDKNFVHRDSLAKQIDASASYSNVAYSSAYNSSSGNLISSAESNHQAQDSLTSAEDLKEQELRLQAIERSLNALQKKEQQLKLREVVLSLETVLNKRKKTLEKINDHDYRVNKFEPSPTTRTYRDSVYTSKVVFD